MNLSDQEVIEQVLAGQQHCFAELVTRYQRPITNYVYRMLGHYEDAVDLSQDVFLKAYSALGSYRPRYPFTAWLFRIARNATIDEIRRRRLSTVSLDQPVDTESGSLTREVPAHGPGPETALLRDEFEEHVEAAIAQLDAKYREPLVLRHSGGLSYEEIAETLQLPLGTVKTRIFRAREALRKLLAEFLEPAGAGAPPEAAG